MTDPTVRAQELWALWAKTAQDHEYSPPEVMVALAGGIAEMIRANCTPAQWDDHLVTVTDQIRFILTGVNPEDRVVENRKTRKTKKEQTHDRIPDDPRRDTQLSLPFTEGEQDPSDLA